jgi:rhodanese-related sulfurtransferase
MRYVLFLLAVACGGGAEPAHAPRAPGVADAAEAGTRSDIDVTELEKVLASGAQLIDVRTPEEYAAGHVPGAVLVPLGFALDDPAIQALDKETPVYVICQSGGRSARASDQLAAGGFDAVNITGGTGAWKASGREIAQ